MIWDRYGFLHELEYYAFYYDKSSPRFGRVADLKDWLVKVFDWCPERLGTLRGLESVLWFLGHPEAAPPDNPWCCELGDRPNPPRRKITLKEMRRLKAEGESFAAIGRVAGISRARVQQLLTKK